MTTIETLFVDASTGETIARADMPVERLPQSFALNTTMHIGGEDWSVIKAEPITAEEFIQTGTLVLTLQKVVKVPVDAILFTLPTICDETPKMLAGSTKQGKDVLELHEDDWRQIEFISLSYRNTIELELEKIRGIYREESVDTGHFLAFKNIHVRQQINAPLAEEISLEQFASFFTSALDRYAGISWQGTDGMVDGGFAFRTSAVLFYGQQVNGRVKILGVKVAGQVSDETREIARSIQRLMATHNLYLIDWCKLQLVPANEEMLSTFLAG